MKQPSVHHHSLFAPTIFHRSVTLLFLILLILSGGCSPNKIFEDNYDIPQQKWEYTQKANFEVAITDTIQRYDVYLNLRHTEAYPYKNLWVIIHTTFPDGKTQDRRVEVPLADSKGKWFGKGRSVINQQIQIQSNAIFPKVGKYQFAIEQNMRTNPLEHVLSVGIGIEKTANTPKTSLRTPTPLVLSYHL